MNRSLHHLGAALGAGLLAMGFGLVLSATALAATSNAPPVVNGWVQVSTPAQLEYIDANQNAPIIAGSSTTYLQAKIQLVANIVLPSPASGSSNWTPLGPFSGTFDGGGHQITGMVIQIVGPSPQYVGFFGKTDMATVTNLGLSGKVAGNPEGDLYIGLIAGWQDGGTISECYTTGSVADGAYDGGLVGQQAFADTAVITNSYTNATVSALFDAGGIVGLQRDNVDAAISNSYATGSVSGGGEVGGVVGYQLSSSTSMSTVTNSYFDTTTTGQSVGIGGGGGTSDSVYGKSTSAMQELALYTATGWNFSSVWGMAPTLNGGLPYLKWQYPTVVAPPTLLPEAVTVDGINTQVVGNLGYNPESAIRNGTLAGYVEERAAILVGASFTHEGIQSSYLSAVLDGSGVGLQQHVSAVQQGEFAALYQKLGIIPTWSDNTVSIPQGVTALLKAGAPTLAIENYLVQLDGFSWPAAQTQAASGFPMQSGT